MEKNRIQSQIQRDLFSVEYNMINIKDAENESAMNNYINERSIYINIIEEKLNEIKYKILIDVFPFCKSHFYMNTKDVNELIDNQVLKSLTKHEYLISCLDCYYCQNKKEFETFVLCKNTLKVISKDIESVFLKHGIKQSAYLFLLIKHLKIGDQKFSDYVEHLSKTSLGYLSITV